jgi:hypothetical protein
MGFSLSSSDHFGTFRDTSGNSWTVPEAATRLFRGTPTSKCQNAQCKLAFELQDPIPKCACASLTLCLSSPRRLCLSASLPLPPAHLCLSPRASLPAFLRASPIADRGSRIADSRSLIDSGRGRWIGSYVEADSD